MIEEEASVSRVSAGLAEIVTERRGACGACSAKHGCGTSLLATWLPQRRLSFRIPNEIGARVGDRVVVGLDEGALQRGSLLLYAAPLGGLLSGAIIGEGIFPRVGWSSELGAVLLGLLGLTLALGLVRRIAAGQEASGRNGIRLLRFANRSRSFSPDDLLSPWGHPPKSIRNRE